MTFLIRIIIIFIMAVPALLNIIFLVTGSIDFLGLDTQGIYYSDGDLDLPRLSMGILISVVCLIVGMLLNRFLKAFDSNTFHHEALDSEKRMNL